MYTVRRIYMLRYNYNVKQKAESKNKQPDSTGTILRDDPPLLYATPAVFRGLLDPRTSSSFSLSPFAYNDDVERCAVRSTMDVPSRNRVLKSTLAFVKRPSLSDTTMNCEPLNRVRNSCPICCVCERSKAASISSKMYIGAGLNCSSDMMRDRAIKDR